MLAPWWLLTIGILTDLVTRTIVGGKAYGSIADALLGITGAFFVNWMLEALSHTTMPWSNSASFTIWGAAALPLLALLHETSNSTEAVRFLSYPMIWFRGIQQNS